MKTLFDYMDFREYLHDFYEEKKREHTFYSYRLFSQKAGFKSPNFLKLVIDKKRNLSKESVFRFCKALGHNKKECEYFENLVFFNQSRTLEEKNTYLSALMKYRTRTDPKKIEKSEFDYFSQWYHPVVRELATSMNFNDDFRKLGQMVIPSIGAAEAEKSVRLLLALDYIRRNDDGAYSKTAATLTTGFGRSVRSVAVANYHRGMIDLASQSIERFKAAQRNIESLTVSVSNETYQAMIARAHDFMAELLKMAENDRENERVAQVNIQLFPLSEKIPPKNSGDGKS